MGMYGFWEVFMGYEGEGFDNDCSCGSLHRGCWGCAWPTVISEECQFMIKGCAHIKRPHSYIRYVSISGRASRSIRWKRLWVLPSISRAHSAQWSLRTDQKAWIWSALFGLVGVWFRVCFTLMQNLAHWIMNDIVIRENEYSALKLLTVHATNQKTNELSALESIKKDTIQFTWSDRSLCSKKSPRRLPALSVLGPDVEIFRLTAPSKSLPIHTVQKIIAEVLEPLSRLHQSGIVHGGGCIFCAL